MAKRKETIEQMAVNLPDVEIKEKGMPETKIENKPLPSKKIKSKALPVVGNPENTIIINGEVIEIKPTKLKYHRSNVTSIYRLFGHPANLTLMDMAQVKAGSFGSLEDPNADHRDGDKALLDFIIAVFDDDEVATKVYNELDQSVFDKILAIFKRVNKLDEAEAKQSKNVEAARETKE